MNAHHANLLRYFSYSHLPEYLREVSAPFHDLAKRLAERGSNDPAEASVALRKLLESKDAAVRSVLPRDDV